MVSARIAAAIALCTGCIDEAVSEKTDRDHDGIPNETDNCEKYNPTQGDRDGDGLGDACEQGIAYDFGSREGWNVPDGRAELVTFRPRDGWWYIHTGTNESIELLFGNSKDRPVAGDFDGDAVADLGLITPDSKLVWRTVLDAMQTTQLLPGAGWTTNQLVFADYDGDSITDPAMFDTSTGTWTVVRSSDGDVLTEALAEPGDTPLVGDMNGDSRADFIAYRSRPGDVDRWYRWSSVDRELEVGIGGFPGDIPVAVDLEGDGRTEVVSWRAPEVDQDPPYAYFFRGDVSLVSWGARGDCPAAFNHFRTSPTEWVAFRRYGIEFINQNERLNHWYVTDAVRTVVAVGSEEDELIPLGIPESCSRLPR